MRAASRAMLLGLALLVSCRSPGGSSPTPADAARATTTTRTAPNEPQIEPESASSDAAAVADAGPPAVERACTRDDECAVARVAVSGDQACCLACATTPGTRRWHAALQRYCAAHEPTNCGALGCPEGPTRAICRDGQCEATWLDANGQPTRVSVEDRCLPGLVCDAWAGCVRADGNTQDGWFVFESDRVARGEIAGLERVATTDGAAAEAFRLYPPGVECPPQTIPSILPPPPSCSLVDNHCVAAGR